MSHGSTAPRVTIAAIGSLLSLRSAQGTFPNLSNFRLAYLGLGEAPSAQLSLEQLLAFYDVPTREKTGNVPPSPSFTTPYQRVFAHPASFFFKMGITVEILKNSGVWRLHTSRSVLGDKRNKGAQGCQGSLRQEYRELTSALRYRP